MTDVPWMDWYQSLVKPSWTTAPPTIGLSDVAGSRRANPRAAFGKPWASSTLEPDSGFLGPRK
jgi:hypothetical protein